MDLMEIVKCEITSIFEQTLKRIYQIEQHQRQFTHPHMITLMQQYRLEIGLYDCMSIH